MVVVTPYLTSNGVTRGSRLAPSQRIFTCATALNGHVDLIGIGSRKDFDVILHLGAVAVVNHVYSLVYGGSTQAPKVGNLCNPIQWIFAAIVVTDAGFEIKLD